MKFTVPACFVKIVSGMIEKNFFFVIIVFIIIRPIIINIFCWKRLSSTFHWNIVIVRRLFLMSSWNSIGCIFLCILFDVAIFDHPLRHCGCLSAFIVIRLADFTSFICWCCGSKPFLKNCQILLQTFWVKNVWQKTSQIQNDIHLPPNLF